MSGLDPRGQIVPPVQSISVEVMQLVQPWEAVPTDLPYYRDFEGARMARYSVLMHADLATGSMFEVEEVLDFMAVPRDPDQRSIWQLLGIRRAPRDDGKAMEPIGLENLLSLYRTCGYWRFRDILFRHL